MDQDIFVRKNKDSWDRLDDLLLNIRKKGIRRMSKTDLDTLSRLYRKACGDLAFARETGYDRTLCEHINGCVCRAHSEIYQEEPFSIAEITGFYDRYFPSYVRENIKYIFISFLIFLAGFSVVFFVVYYRPELASDIVPEYIVKAYENGIGERHVNGELSSPMKATLSHKIMTNNIMVGIKAFAFGIFFGIGTVYLLFTNGALLGALAALSSRNNDSLVFWSLILPHGVIELPAIFICAGAGFLLAAALIYPGRFERIEALKINSRKASQLMLGAILLFVVAAVIEGFLTPVNFSPWIKLCISFLLFVIMLLYFVRTDKKLFAKSILMEQ